MYQKYLALLSFVALLYLGIGIEITSAEDSTTKCQACRKLVVDFNKGKQSTARENFAGGDVAWEEEKRLSYSTSETRLIEILENVCTKDHKCQHILEMHEELLETWWFEKQKQHPDLQDWFCVQHVKVCCAAGTYGKQCIECPGGASTPCGGQGQCDGDGDREGKGTCSCNDGYTGKSCAMCSAGFFLANDSADALRCDRCAAACEKNCTGAGAGSCEDCADGYEEEAGVCTDVDECGRKDAPCQNKQRTYCLNTIGSYQCAACHVSCNSSCTGSGADQCDECTAGYVRDDASAPCKDFDECKDHQSRWLPPPRPEDPDAPYPGCNFSTYCHNTEGSFECRDCDVACDGCSAAGRESCSKCASGYVMEDKHCNDVDECINGSGTCDAELEICANTDGSFRCDCASKRKRVNGKCPPKRPPKVAVDDDDDDEDVDEQSISTSKGKSEL